MTTAKPTFEQLTGITSTTNKTSFQDIINKPSLEDLYQPGLQMQGGYIPSTPQERPGLITRALKGLARKTIIDPIKAIETKSRGVGGAGTLLETIDLVKQFKKEQGRSPTYEEYNELSQYGKLRSIQRTQETYQMYDVPLAETLEEKGVELATGVTSFITKLGLTKKILGGQGLASDVMSFEMVHEADGGTPGVGALLGYSLGAFGKMPAPTLARKGLRMAGQSATLAGFTAAAGGTPEDIAVAALLPPVMHTLRMFPAMMKGKMTDAKLANELGKRFPSMQDIPIKSRVKWARAMRDANKVKTNEMTADAWGKKHGKNLYDFSEQAKTAFNGKGYDRLQLPGIAEEGFKESLMRTYPKISPKVADKAMQIYNTQGLQAAGTYVMGEIRHPVGISKAIQLQPETNAAAFSKTIGNESWVKQFLEPYKIYAVDPGGKNISLHEALGREEIKLPDMQERYKTHPNVINAAFNILKNRGYQVVELGREGTITEAKPVAKADEAHYKKAGIYISAKAREIFTGPMKGGLWNARTMDATLIANKQSAKEAYTFLVKYGDQYASTLSEQEQKQWQNIKNRSAQILKEKITPEEALKEPTKPDYAIVARPKGNLKAQIQERHKKQPKVLNYLEKIDALEAKTRQELRSESTSYRRFENAAMSAIRKQLPYLDFEQALPEIKNDAYIETLKRLAQPGSPGFIKNAERQTEITNDLPEAFLIYQKNGPANRALNRYLRLEHLRGVKTQVISDVKKWGTKETLAQARRAGEITKSWPRPKEVRPGQKEIAFEPTKLLSALGEGGKPGGQLYVGARRFQGKLSGKRRWPVMYDVLEERATQILLSDKSPLSEKHRKEISNEIKKANRRRIDVWSHLYNKFPQWRSSLAKAWSVARGWAHHQAGLESKFKSWPSWKEEVDRLITFGKEKPVLNIVGKIPNVDRAEVSMMSNSPFYSKRADLVYQKNSYEPTESEVINDLGDKLYGRAKDKNLSFVADERVYPHEGRIRIETFSDGLDRVGTLAHARGHIGLRYVRETSPKLFKKIQAWYRQRLKRSGTQRPLKEMFARAYALEARGLRSSLPRDVINEINRLNNTDIPDKIFQRMIDNWNDPDFAVSKKPIQNLLMKQEVIKRLEDKALISENQKLRPGARRLAKQFTGKTDLNKMTDDELAKFGQIISRLPEPTYNNRGQRVPPSIPKTTALIKKGEFETEYREPTFLRIFHAPEYYAEKLGVKDLVEKAERGKIEFSMEYQQLSNKVAGWIKQIEKLGKTTLREKTKAKIKNIPTAAVARFRNLLDIHEEPPESLSPKEKELFNNFRNLSRMLLARENEVRESLELEPIKYRKAYVRHVAQGLAKDMLEGRYPFPQGRKFWAEEIIAKKIYNTMEMQRKLEEDLEGIFTEDLGYATNSMLWTALKEIHLSQPIRYLEQQLSARGKDIPDYQNLSPSERAVWDKIITIPSRTRRWVKDYVNTTIKGQQSWLDQDIEAIIKKTGLNGLINKFLAPFGRTLSYKPVANFVTSLGRAQILGVMGWRPKQIIRNKFQTLQSMALYPLYKETWRTYAPIRALRKNTPQLDRLLKKSLFLKAYTGTEEWPVDIKSKIAKAKLADFQWSAVTNARQAMETAYWGMLPLFTNPKFKHYGWADPKRTYKEKPEFLYSSEEKLMLKEMEFGAAATQHNYTPIGMPEIFRHKTLTPITRLQSWWMNHYFRFSEEAFRRAFTGRPTYSKEDGPSLPWKYRLGWLRYALIAIPILNAMRYQRSFLFGAAPTGVPPFAQFGLGFWNYVVGKGAGNEQQWKRGKKQMAQSGKTFIPGYMTYKDWEAIWSGRKDLESLFFYKKR